MGRKKHATPDITLIRLARVADAWRAADEHAKTAREARDDEIEQADLAGTPIQHIAQAVKMSRSQVLNIVADRTAARQERIRAAAGL